LEDLALMRFWFGLGLLSIGAVLLVQVPLSTSTVAVLGGRPHLGAGQLGLLRQPIGKAEDGLEDEQAEQLIARGIAEDRQGHPAAALSHFQEALLFARRSNSELSGARAL